jgi:hypothetical protein
MCITMASSSCAAVDIGRATASKEPTAAHDDLESVCSSTEAGSVAESDLSTEQVLFIFDWDDTLFPTASLSKHGLLTGRARPSQEQWRQLAELAERTIETLEAAQREGAVMIITNAAEGWVQQSCMHFTPSLAPVLQRFPIISARASFEPLGISCPTEWKRRAFEREVDSLSQMLPEEAVVSLVSIGDSVHEHLALLSAAKKMVGYSAKSLKLAEKPSIEQLVDEQVLVAGALEDIVAHEGDLDIDVAAAV